MLHVSNVWCNWTGWVLCLIISGFPEQPDPPKDLELTDQRERSVQLTWTPGDDNNSPIQCEFFVCYVVVDQLVIHVIGQQKHLGLLFWSIYIGYLSVPGPIWRFAPRAWSMGQYDWSLRYQHHSTPGAFPVCVLLLQGPGTQWRGSEWTQRSIQTVQNQSRTWVTLVRK